ncbi:MAG TPA: GatB/YqeY domain-containing protein [SAR86 cluster bacterium]|nr:GatB/YqeY domain-containing protein [SAR86 cluster bacterium]|tara:strand:+ start:19255 stop:19710 length:456 start_codon:yes stop_codon:yes gene_type:complete
MANQTIRPLIEEAVKFSMKNKDKETTSTLRMAISELQKEEIDKRTELEDEQVIQILQRMIKQRKDSYSQFSDAGRNELAEREENEIKILNEFLPEQLNEEEIKVFINESLKETHAEGPQDMGKVMGSLKSKIQGNADMGLVSKLVKESLSN